MTTNPLRGAQPQTSGSKLTKEQAEAKVRQFNTHQWVIDSGSQFYVKQKDDGSWTWNCNLGPIPPSPWRVEQERFEALLDRIGRVELSETQLNNLPDKVKRVADCRDYIRLDDKTKRYVYRSNTLKENNKQSRAA